MDKQNTSTHSRPARMTAAQARNISCQLHAKASSTRHHRDAEHADRAHLFHGPHHAAPCWRTLPCHARDGLRHSGRGPFPPGQHPNVGRSSGVPLTRSWRGLLPCHEREWPDCERGWAPRPRIFSAAWCATLGRNGRCEIRVRTSLCCYRPGSP